jgi:hypothetical protein
LLSHGFPSLINKKAIKKTRRGLSGNKYRIFRIITVIKFASILPSYTFIIFAETFHVKAIFDIISTLPRSGRYAVMFGFFGYALFTGCHKAGF